MLSAFFRFASILIGAILAILAVSQASHARTLRVSLATSEAGFDPVAVADLYSHTVIEAILEPMLTFAYAPGPVKLIPNTAQSLPQVSDGGKTYTFRIKPGIFFTTDPAFEGKPRELTAGDYAYSIKRLFDPKIKSPWLFLLEGKIVGMGAALKDGKFDYDIPVPGLEIPDRYTLRLRLTAPDYNLPYIVAISTLGAVAREVVERYGDDIGSHPVGTGRFQFRRDEYQHGHKIVLEKNAAHRSVAGTGGEKTIDRVEISVIEEAQPRYLAFLDGELDYLELPREFGDVATPGGKLAPNLAKRNIAMHALVQTDVTYTYFNMEDPLVGGYSKEKVALRRAIAMAYNRQHEIDLIHKGLAIPAHSPIPPGVAGFDPLLVTDAQTYNPAKAQALLDLYGYRDRDGDGFRDLPDGHPLILEYASPNDQLYRQFDELWKRCLDRVGLRVQFKKGTWQELVKQRRLGKLQMTGSAWYADYPDGENFLQLLYGPNVDQGNDSRFKLPAFDRLYEEARTMPDSAARTKLYREMAKLVAVYAPWRFGVHRKTVYLVQPWLRGFVAHPLIHAPWAHLELGER